MADETRDTGTVHEKEMVDAISDVAWQEACERAPMAYADEPLPGTEVKAATENDDIPDAAQFLDRSEDGFISALAIIVVPRDLRDERRLAVISRPFGYVRTVGDTRFAVVAPLRFVTDFASIPGWARWLISSFGKHAEAAVIHDWLYTIGTPGNEAERERADDLFRVALDDLGVDPIRRNLMHRAVRIGGKKAFGNAAEFRFRHLDTLDPVEPRPTAEPYLRTFAFRKV